MANAGVLRIGIAYWTGLMETCVVEQRSFKRTPKCLWFGFDGELLSVLLTITRIPYQLIPYTGNDTWGEQLTNLSWTGMLGDVVDGRIDMIGSSYSQPEVANIDAFTLSTPTSFSPMFILKTTQEVSAWQRAILVFDVFESTLWLAFIVAIISLSVVLTLHQYNDGQKSPKKMILTIVDEIYRSFGFALSQLSQTEGNSTKFSIRMLTLSLGIGVLFFTALYQGCLLTRLLINPISKRIDTIDAVTNAINGNNYKLIVYDGAISAHYIKTTVGRQFDRLREAIKHNPIIIAPEIESILQNVRTTPGIYLSTDYSEMMTIAQNVRRNIVHILVNQLQQCDMQVIELIDGRVDIGVFVLRKNNTLARQLSDTLEAHRGISENTQQKYHDYLRRRSICYAQDYGDGEAEYESLEIDVFLGLCSVFIAGLAIATAYFFIFEKFFNQ